MSHCRCCLPAAQPGPIVPGMQGGEQLHSCKPQAGEESMQGTHHTSFNVSAQVSNVFFQITYHYPSSDSLSQ